MQLLIVQLFTGAEKGPFMNVYGPLYFTFSHFKICSLEGPFMNVNGLTYFKFSYFN